MVALCRPRWPRAHRAEPGSAASASQNAGVEGVSCSVPHNLPEALGLQQCSEPLGLSRQIVCLQTGLLDFSISKLAVFCSLSVPACPGETLPWSGVGRPAPLSFRCSSSPRRTKAGQNRGVHSGRFPAGGGASGQGVEPALTDALVSEMDAFKGVGDGFGAHRCQPHGAGRDDNGLSDNQHSEKQGHSSSQANLGATRT